MFLTSRRLQNFNSEPQGPSRSIWISAKLICLCLLPLDASQGGGVWRLKSETKKGNLTYLTYERSRERPRAEVSYPLFTFTKSGPDDQMLLHQMQSNLRTESGRRFPVSVMVDYLLPVQMEIIKRNDSSPNISIKP